MINFICIPHLSRQTVNALLKTEDQIQFSDFVIKAS